MNMLMYDFAQKELASVRKDHQIPEETDLMNESSFANCHVAKDGYVDFPQPRIHVESLQR